MLESERKRMRDSLAALSLGSGDGRRSELSQALGGGGSGATEREAGEKATKRLRSVLEGSALKYRIPTLGTTASAHGTEALHRSGTLGL